MIAFIVIFIVLLCIAVCNFVDTVKYNRLQRMLPFYKKKAIEALRFTSKRRSEPETQQPASSQLAKTDDCDAIANNKNISAQARTGGINKKIKKNVRRS
ncbi:MAG: hypothetical protein IKP37_06720 [Paludibacteraceae bacterium]|nr:hypothetical protein [Paludibacteraceae bacterium]